MMWRPVTLALAFALALGVRDSGQFSVRAETTGTITVFAAASLKNALDAAAADYSKKTGDKVSISYAATPALAKQIEQGGPADVFISADVDWMNYLAGKKLIKDETRTRLTRNSLVLIAPENAKMTLKISKGFALAEAIGDGKLVMADVKTVPAGKYGKAALDYLGVWSSVEAKIAQTENVRAALALVGRQEAALGIVYQTDANAEPKVKVLDTFPEESHPEIVYYAAVTAESTRSGAGLEFITYLKAGPAQALFAQQGFKAAK